MTMQVLKHHWPSPRALRDALLLSVHSSAAFRAPLHMCLPRTLDDARGINERT